MDSKIFTFATTVLGMSIRDDVSDSVTGTDSLCSPGTSPWMRVRSAIKTAFSDNFLISPAGPEISAVSGSNFTSPTNRVLGF